MPEPRKWEQGYSLVELMVAVVVMGVVLTFAAPPMARYLREQQLLGSAEALAGDFRLCRERATAEGANVLASWSLDNAELTAFVDRNGNAGHDSDEPTVFSLELPPSVTLTNASEGGFANTRVTFQSDGATSESGKLVLTLGEEMSRQVQVIRATGLVKVTR